MVSDGCIMLLPESLSPGEQLEGLRGLNMVDISQISAPKIILGPPKNRLLLIGNCPVLPKSNGPITSKVRYRHVVFIL